MKRYELQDNKLDFVSPCGKLVFCSDGVRQHFDIEGQREVTMCFSARRPRGDSEWYELVPRPRNWRVLSSNVRLLKRTSSTLRAAFPDAKRLYCWIEL